MKNSLRFQLLSRSLFFLAIILLLIGVFQYVFMREFIFTSTASNVRSQVMSIPREAWVQMYVYSALNNEFSSKNEDNTTVPDKGENRIPFPLTDSNVAFIDTQGTVIPLAGKDFHKKSPPQLGRDDYQSIFNSNTSLNYKVVTASDGEELLVVFHPLEVRKGIIGLIQVSMSTKFLQDVLLRQLFTFLLLSLFALIGGLLAYQAVIKKTLVPLSNIVDTVEKIDAGNLSERLPADQGQMEIDRLAVSFNGMLERLENSFIAEKEAKEQMRRFVADASHELRTPLTSIHGFLEVLLRGAMNQPEKLRKSLNSMYAESGRMKKLVEDLLLLAKIDRSPKLELEESELAKLIRNMEPQLALLADKRQVAFNLESELYCRIDDDKMKQVILNIFNNAVQHTDPVEGRITVCLGEMNQGAELVIIDNGPGILKEHLPYLFDRFYRSESSRSRKYGGAGLGLAITRSLVELQGGTIRVESELGEGSKFIIWLPSLNNIKV